jgi:hypothetical protein
MRATRIVLLATLVVIGTASVSCTRDTVRGSGNVVARNVAVPSFSRLQVASAFEVTVSLGGQPSLTLHIDDNLDRHIDVGVDGDTLHIGLRRGTSVSDATLQAAVTAPSLARIQGSGSSRISLQDTLAGGDLHLELSGASNAEVLVRRTISASLSGASSLRYLGSPTLTRQDTSGGSSIMRVR